MKKKTYIQPMSEQEVWAPLLLQEFTGSSDDVHVGGEDDSDEDPRAKEEAEDFVWGNLW
ncbi:MAG: hypothetical protein K5778_06205 [Bacteroidaceae bacterium]|nr:hypothetical protein [Bacteroidaceae bacterium]